MLLDHNDIVDLLIKLTKKLQLDEPITIDEICKKVTNKNLQYITKKKEFNIEEPTLASSFFINNTVIEINKNLIDDTSKFDIDLVLKIIQINNDQYELTDYNGNTLVLNKEDVFIKVKDKIPMDLFLNML